LYCIDLFTLVLVDCSKQNMSKIWIKRNFLKLYWILLLPINLKQLYWIFKKINQ
jgi:hypothetical protein